MSATRALILIGLLVSTATGQQIFYSEDFEGLTGMTVTGGGWQFGTPSVVGPTTVPEGTKCAGTILNGNYIDNANYQMVTPSISLPDTSVISLTYIDWQQTESSCDYARLAIEQNGSGSWTELWSSSSSTSTWTTRKFNLSSYRNSTIRLRFTFTSDGSVVYPGWYIDDIRIYRPLTRTLTVTASSGGTTSPSGTVSVESGIPQTITATPSTGYRFTNWTVTSGSATFANANSYSTTVTITGDATIRANFTAGTIYSITASDATYNFTTHYYTGTSPSGGVAFRFTAPASGSYAVVIGDGAVTTNKYLYYYDTSSAFGSIIRSQSGTGTLTMTFTATAGTNYYFKVVPYSSSYYTNDFTIRYSATPTLTLTNDGNGTTSPSGNVAVISGASTTITATPAAGYRFGNWSVTSGSATFANANAYSTTVTITGDATIRANFSAGTVYSITTAEATYNFTTHYYSGTTPSGGVAFRFTAPASGSYAVVVRDGAAAANKYLYYYDTSSTFGSIIRSQSGTGTLTLTFTAIVGTNYYFKVVPYSSSYYTNDFIIRYATTPTLTVSNDGHGTTSPSGSTAVVAGVATAVSAIPAADYRFSKWTVESGSAVIADTNAQSTTATISSNATIMARFTPGIVYAISNIPVAYNFTTHYYSIDPGYGVRYMFTAPTPGNYVVSLRNTDTTSCYFYDFGADSTFSTYVRRQASTRWNLTYAFTAAAAGERRYFKVDPLSNVYWGDFFSLYWAPGLTLTPATVTATLNPGQVLTEHKVLHMPADVSPPKADIIIAMDLTGSMGGELTNVKTNSLNIINQIRGLIPDARFGVMSHMDYNGSFSGCSYSNSYGGGSDYPYRLDQRLTDSINAITTAINSLALGNGSDGPEDYTRVLFETYSDSAVGWRSGAKRIVLFWQDYIPHDCNYGLDSLATGTTGPDPGRDAVVGTADDLDLATVLSGMKTTNTVLIGLHSGGYLSYWQYYARKTGGNSFLINSDGTIPSGTDIATYITGLIQQEVKHIDTLRLAVCTPGYTSWLTSITPAFYYNINLDTAKDFTFDIRITPPMATAPGVYPFSVCAKGDGVEYASQLVTIRVPGDENNPPIADAGPDQTVPAGTGCQAEVTLNGTGSSDPDGDPITYSWVGPFSGIATGSTPIVTLPLGNHLIVLTVHDDKGDSAKDSVHIIVVDRTAPVPDLSSLPDVAGTCSATIGSTPTATDNCSGAITGTTADPLTYSTQGTHTVHWTYNDGSGNIATQEQRVIINDNIPPVPDVETLPIIRDACLATISSRPTATDNCRGAITGTTSDPLTYSSQGTFTIHWTYNDGNGNASTQEQTVVVRDTVAPEAETDPLPEVRAGCSIEVSAPYAVDACEGRIRATTADPTNITTQGIHTITWDYDDGNGNTLSQTQTVIIKDTLAPVLSSAPDTSLIISALADEVSVTIDSADVMDDCGLGTLEAARNDGNGLNDPFRVGTTVIIWKACDAVDNCDSVAQRVIVRRNKMPHIQVVADTTVAEGTTLQVRVTANDSDGTALSLSADDVPPGAAFVDSGNGIGLLSWNIGCTDNGTYVPIFRVSDGIDSSDAAAHLLVTDVNFPPRFDPPIGDQTINENEQLDLTIRAIDCDGTTPRIRAVSIPRGAGFTDNGDGTATFSWKPKCDQNGYYIVIFETIDDATAVRDTIKIRVKDVNCYPPVITLSDDDVEVGLNLPVTVTVKATDGDGTPPLLSIDGLPSGAKFDTDGDGNGVLRWTPQTIGVFTSLIVAVDQADPAVRVDTVITITVLNRNITGPVFLPKNDTVIDENQPLTLSVTARDPDGTIPLLRCIQSLVGATFSDPGSGTGILTWRPGYASHGDYGCVFTATDGEFSDTLELTVTVRDVNFAPIFNPMTDKNVRQGDLIRFTVSAYDPDNDGIIPELSVACTLPGYTFDIAGDGSGVFRWTATLPAGSYPVTFYASDGFLTTSAPMTISVNKQGSIKIVTDPGDAVVYACPTSTYPGWPLGSGSVTYSAAPGTYWFRAEAPGYRPITFTGIVPADSTSEKRVALRPSIPLMFMPAETLLIGSTTDAPSGNVACIDFNNDGIQDLSVASGASLSIYLGDEAVSDLHYNEPAIPLVMPSGIDSIVTHGYIDWNNDGAYDCIVSTRNGRIIVATIDNEIMSTPEILVQRSGEKLFPFVFDKDKDGRKDLLFLSKGKGLYFCRNEGTDKAPRLAGPVALGDTTGGQPSALKGEVLRWDLDADGYQELIGASGSYVQIMAAGGDSLLANMPEGIDLNGGGRRIGSANISCALMLVPDRLPRLVTLGNGKASVFRTRLLGDVTGDGMVDITDISRISKALEKREGDEEWYPLYNLKLDDSGAGESIDVRDISRASKSWELSE
jgi:hypothetical protein